MPPRLAAPASRWPGRRGSSRCYTASQSIKSRYVDATLAQQTRSLAVHKMRDIDKPQSQQEEFSNMLEMNIRQFMEAARQNLFGLLPVQPAFATIPAMVRQVR